MLPFLPSNPAGIDATVERLRAGDLVALPTETVYGLAADAANGEAVAAIYATKGRPHFNPLIVHVASLADATELAHFTALAETLAQQFWPGPLTLVLPLRATADISTLVTAGLDTVAIRVPQHAIARAVLERLGRPFVAPSANRSGKISPTSAQHVADEFGDRVPILDGGPCDAGIESTIVALTGDRPTLLRPGAIATAAIQAITGPMTRPGGGAVVAPGMMTSHYAPTVPLRLNAKEANTDEVMLGFGGTPGATLDLSPRGNLAEAAANLFDLLRRLDGEGRPVAVAPIPNDGLGEAINDRLRRAAAPAAKT